MTAIAQRHLVPDVRVAVEVDAQRVVAHVRGRVDYVTVGVMRDRLLELARRASGSLVIDLTDADLADPTGPAALLHIYDVCRTRSIAFAVDVAPGSAAEATLRGCGLLGLLRRPSTGVVPGQA
jgi:anti-anti-sigma factor